MRITPGVRLLGIRPELLLGVIIVDQVFREHGHEWIWTAGIDRVHSRGSLHYVGAAADGRRWGISEARLQAMAQEAREALGWTADDPGDFDLVVERTHLHLEWQPKRPYTGSR